MISLQLPIFPYPPTWTRNPGIIPSDDPGEALSVSSKDIHLSKHAKISGIHCTLWPQCTNVTDRRTDRRTLTYRSIYSARCIYYKSVSVSVSLLWNLTITDNLARIRADVGEDVRVGVGVGPMEFQLYGAARRRIRCESCFHAVGLFSMATQRSARQRTAPRDCPSNKLN